MHNIWLYIDWRKNVMAWHSQEHKSVFPLGVIVLCTSPHLSAGRYVSRHSVNAWNSIKQYIYYLFSYTYTCMIKFNLKLGTIRD